MKHLYQVACGGAVVIHEDRPSGAGKPVYVAESTYDFRLWTRIYCVSYLANLHEAERHAHVQLAARWRMEFASCLLTPLASLFDYLLWTGIDKATGQMHVSVHPLHERGFSDIERRPAGLLNRNCPYDYLGETENFFRVLENE